MNAKTYNSKILPKCVTYVYVKSQQIVRVYMHTPLQRQTRFREFASPFEIGLNHRNTLCVQILWRNIFFDKVTVIKIFDSTQVWCPKRSCDILRTQVFSLSSSNWIHNAVLRNTTSYNAGKIRNWWVSIEFQGHL